MSRRRRRRELTAIGNTAVDKAAGGPPPDDVPMLAELGVSGLNQHSGYIREEWHKDLRGTTGVRIYREMADNHPVIGGAFFLIEMIIRQLKIMVEASGESPDHLRAQELVESALDDIDGGVNKVMGDALTVMPFGWAWLEKNFKISRGRSDQKVFNSKFDDGLIRWRSFAIRAQESLHRWELDPQGNVLAMIQLPPNEAKFRPIPRSKSIHIRLLSRKDNPEGRNLLRHIYTSYYFEKQHKFTEAVGIWRNLAGFPRIKVPVSYTTATPGSAKAQAYEKYVDMGKKIAADEYACVVMPTDEDENGLTGFDFDLIASSGKNAAETDPIIQRYRSEIAMGLSAQFMLLGQASVGSFALADNQTDMFTFAVAGIVDSILDAINEDAVPELLELNGIDPVYSPTITRSDIETKDLAGLGSFLSQMASTGFVTPDDALEDHLREQAGLPQREAQEQPASDDEPGDMDPGITPEELARFGLSDE